MDSDPSGHPHKPLILDEELSELRAARAGDGFRQAWTRCLVYARRFGRTLTLQDREDIVSEAFAQEMDSILNPDMNGEQVSIPLAKALRRNRARVVRRRCSETSRSPERSLQEDHVVALHLKDAARQFMGFIGQAIDGLEQLDRNLLIQEYKLERLKMRPQGDSPRFTSPGARKVARSRALKKLMAIFVSLVSEADAAGELAEFLERAEAVGGPPALRRAVRVLMRNLTLAMAPASRKPPRPET